MLGLSVDSEPCLKAWAESLDGIDYPLLSDFYPHGEVAEAYGVLRAEGYSERAIFVIDKDGIIRYVDVHDIDEQPDNDELMEVLASLAPAGYRSREPERKAAPEVGPAPKASVTLYCTSWCPACRRARAYLKEKGIDFVEIDINHDREAAQRVRGWANGYETTPTFEVNGQVLIDFDQAKLEKLLENSPSND